MKIFFRKLQKILFFIFFLVFLAIVKILKPIVFIRMGQVDLGRIGGIYSLDWYLSERKYEENKKKYFDIFFYTFSPIFTNKQWKKMWKRKILLLPVPLFFGSIIYFFKKYYFINKHFINDIPVNISGDKLAKFKKKRSEELISKENKRLSLVLKNIDPNIYFTDEETKKGIKLLQELGIPEGKQYVCIHNRDNAYLNYFNPKRNWNYHNYRSCNINNFLKAAEVLIARGYYVVRVGSKVSEPLKVNDKRFIDYSLSKFQSDFLDIFLASRCKFFISSDSGISAIPEVFKIPIVYVNKTFMQHIHRWTHNGIYAFKKFYLKSENRFLKFKEIWDLEWGGSNTMEYFKNLNIELQENTPKEIADLAIEMDEKLNNKSESTKEDNLLQEKFWKIFHPNNLRSSNFKIGKIFLQENQNLL